MLKLPPFNLLLDYSYLLTDSKHTWRRSNST